MYLYLTYGTVRGPFSRAHKKILQWNQGPSTLWCIPGEKGKWKFSNTDRGQDFLTFNLCPKIQYFLFLTSKRKKINLSCSWPHGKHSAVHFEKTPRVKEPETYHLYVYALSLSFSVSLVMSKILLRKGVKLWFLYYDCVMRVNEEVPMMVVSESELSLWRVGGSRRTMTHMFLALLNEETALSTTNSFKYLGLS